MALGTDTKAVVTQWILDNKGTIENIDKQAKAIRAEAKAERDLTMVAKRLGYQIDQNERSAERMTRATKRMSAAASMAKAGFAGLAMAGVGIATRALVDYMKEADKFTQASKIYTGDINAARDATRGLASDVDIMVAKNRLMTLGVKMSDAEFNEMLGNLTKISGAMSIDMKFALESATTMLARQSTAVADNVGVVIKAEEAYEKYASQLSKTANELTASEKKIAFQREALSQLSAKAGEVADRTETAGGALSKLGVSLDNAGAAAAASVSKWKPLVDIINALDTAVKQVSRDMGMIHSGKVATPELRAFLGRQMNEARRRVKSYGIDPDAPTMPAGIPSVTRQSIERQLKLMREYQKKLDALTKQSALKRRQAALLAGKIGEAPIERIVPRAVEDRDAPIGGKKGRAQGRAQKRKTGLDLLPAEGPALPGYEEVLKSIGVGLDQETIARNEATKAALQHAKALREIAASSTEEAMGHRRAREEAQAKANTLYEERVAALRHADALKAIAASSTEEAMGYRRAQEAAQAKAQSMYEMTGAVQTAQDSVQSMATNAVANLAGAMWTAADAAIQGSQSFSEAFGAIVKSTLQGVAITATVQGMMALAEYVASWFTAVPKLKAAGIFFATAAIAGGASLGMSAGGVGAGSSSRSGTGTGTTTPTSASFGKTVEDKRPQYINVYLGDPNSRSSALLLRKELQVQMAGQV